jgi:hypothetical protein
VNEATRLAAQIERWLALGFVVGLEQPIGLLPVVGLEARLLAGGLNNNCNFEGPQWLWPL